VPNSKLIERLNNAGSDELTGLVGQQCQLGQLVQTLVAIRSYDEYAGFAGSYEKRLDLEPYIFYDMSPNVGENRGKYKPKYELFFRARDVTALMFFWLRGDRASWFLTKDHVFLNNNTAWLDRQALLPGLSPDKRFGLVCSSNPGNHAKVAQPVIFIGSRANYYHFIVDFLPYLILADQVPELAGLPFLLQVTTSYQEQFMDMLGIPRQRGMLLAPNEEGSTALVDLDDVVLPAPLPFPVRLELVRKTLSRADGNCGQRKLFIARGNPSAVATRLRNEADVAVFLERHGFETVYLDNSSALAQVDLFGQARCIVAAHGAALANCVFAPKQCRVIELMNDAAAADPSEIFNCYRRLCHCLDLDYHRLTSPVEPGLTGLDARDAAFVCDLARLRQLVADLPTAATTA